MSDQAEEKKSITPAAGPATECGPSCAASGAGRVGVYICRCGGNISDVVDVERVAAAARLMPGVSTAEVHTFMCSDPGQHVITSDILESKVDRIVVASCTPFLHESTFRGAAARGGMNPYLYEHANIREQCSWAHKHEPEAATDKAIRMVAAAVAKARWDEPLDQIRLPNHRTALVVGGGIAGMKAAADLAAVGIRVVLTESAATLGGRLNARGAVYPTEADAEKIVAGLRAEIESSPNVEVLLNSRIKAITGFVGNFQVTIEGGFGPGGETRTTDLTAGVVVVATGFHPYVPADGEFLYATEPAVVAMPDFIQLLHAAGNSGKTLTWQGRSIRSVALIHCVGSRQLDGVHTPQADGRLNTYCSRVCCTTALQQEIALRRRFPETAVFDVYQDIRTYARGAEDYYRNASEAGVVFFRYRGEEPPVVERAPVNGGRNTTLVVRVKDTLTWGQELRLPVDMVVLATGMVPNAIPELVDNLKLPTGEDRFLQEVHPKLRPVEVSVNGVLLAGTAQGPMDIRETLAAAGAAAVKAAAMFAHDSVELNPYVAEVDASVCEGSGVCVAQCEYDGALQMVDVELDGRTVRRAQVNPGLCVGCGACVGVCPHRAIQVSGWRLDQYDAMIDGIVAEVPVAAH
jgi:heterodisulfide reductase subunit A